MEARGRRGEWRDFTLSGAEVVTIGEEVAEGVGVWRFWGPGGLGLGWSGCGYRISSLGKSAGKGWYFWRRYWGYSSNKDGQTRGVR